MAKFRGNPDRQLWATPPEFVAAIEKEAGIKFEVDLCAEAHTAKAPVWYGPGSPWGSDYWAVPAETRQERGPAWCNPPFGFIDPWVDEAIFRSDTLLLIPPRTDRGWYARLVWSCAFRTVITERLEFLPPPGVEASRASGSVELWWTGNDPVLPWVIDLADDTWRRK